MAQNQGQQILEGSSEHTFNFDRMQTFWRETAPTCEITDTYVRSVNRAFFFSYQINLYPVNVLRKQILCISFYEAAEIGLQRKLK